MAINIDQKVVDLNCLFAFNGGVFSTKDCFYPENELSWTERFGDIIIRAQFEPYDTIHLFCLGGEDEDGDGTSLRIRFERPADILSVHFRKHEIQNNETRPFFSCPFQSRSAIHNAQDR